MKNKKILGLPIAVFVIGLMVVAGVSAALLTTFGTVNLDAAVKQAVLVDGNTHGEFETDDIEIIAGSSVCKAHDILNRAEVPVKLKFDSTKKKGIDISFFAYDSMRLLDQDDFSDSSFDFDATIEKREDSIRILVTDTDLSDVYTPYVQAVIMDSDKNFKYNTGYNSDAADPANNWTGVYKEYDNGWGSAIDVTGTGVYVQKNANDVEIIIPDSMYDEDDLIALNVEGIGQGSAIQSRYPTTFDWSTADGVPFTVKDGKEIHRAFTMDAGETMVFDVCYDFAVNLEEKNYDLYTNVDFISSPGSGSQ